MITTVYSHFFLKQSINGTEKLRQILKPNSPKKLWILELFYTHRRTISWDFGYKKTGGCIE